MKRLLVIVAMLTFSGLALMAQQTPSTPTTPSTPDAGSTPSQQQTTSTPDADSSPSQQTDATNLSQSARSFEGKIMKSGDQLVLRDSATETSYKLDDQDKAKQYEGKNVKVTANLDASSNTLHVVEIIPSEQ